MINLENKVAVIPGGATMIGRKVAHEFIRAGAKVTVCDIDEAGGRELEQEAGDALKFIPADITDDAQVDAVIQQTLDQWGGIDCLVNVACTYLDNGLASTRAEWREALDVNLVSGAIFVQKVAPHMRRRGGGAVVNFASISGKRAQPGRMLYAASKAAIIGATRNEALLLAQDNIRVNCVSPRLGLVERDTRHDRERPGEGGPGCRGLSPVRPGGGPGGGRPHRGIPVFRCRVRHQRRRRAC